MSCVAPRVVVVTRETEYEALLRRHGTRAQAAFFLQTRGQTLTDIDARHATQKEALQRVLSAIPATWRRSHVDRRDLARFVFEPSDTLVCVGQDGLLANLAKYLTEQMVIGINPDFARYDGVLARHRPEHAEELLRSTVSSRSKSERRTMVEVRLDDGQRLLALNEVFLGHRSHQSARYRIRYAGSEERQASSGAIVASGTGATGWAKSIHRERAQSVDLPLPCERRLVFFVREAFPSVSTQAALTTGQLHEAEQLELVSEMDDSGVIFGDGMEEDCLAFPWGARAQVAVATRQLALVV